MRPSIVADHLKELMVIVDDKPQPREDLSTRERTLYWRYHGYFPNEFARAVADMIAPKKFISYDHLQNVLTYE